MHLGNLSSQRILMFILMGIMLISMVSALDWDNIKDYDSATKTYTITNALGMGETIAKIKLNTPQVNPVGVGYVEVFEMNFETFDDYTDAIQDIKFYNVKDGMKPVEIDLDYKYQVLKNVTGEQCLIDEKSANKTQTCKNITIESYVWESYNGKDILKGNITISGWTTTKQGDKIEWIPTYFGEKLDAWAVWTAGLNTDLIRYYKLNETSGTATDFVGGYNGIVVGATQGASGKIGTGYSFDGNDYVYADPAGLTTGSNDGSICAWFNTTTAGYRNVVNWGNYAAVGDMRGMVITNNNKFGVSQYGGVVESNSLINTGNWVFGCIVADQFNSTYANWSVYVNGTLEKYGLLVQNGLLVNFSIGKVAKTTAEFWAGNIDEVGIWNRTLTSAEVTQLYNGGTGITYTSDFGALDIVLNSPSIDASLTDKDVVFNCTGSDETAVQNVSLIINGSYNNTNATVVNVTPVINTIPLADGYYNWTCEVCDNEDNCENATARNFNINTAPTINVFSPPVNTSNYTTNTIFINATSTLPIGKWIANYNGTNYTLATINTSLTIEDGNHHLLLYGNNSDSGKWGLNNTYYFNVDATKPQFVIHYPTGTIDYHKLNTNLTLNYTITDTHRDSCWYDLSGTNYTLNCSTNSSINITNYTLGNIRIWANDTFGNINSSLVSWDYRLLEFNNSYTSEVTEGQNTWFNISFHTNGTAITIGNLTYNNSYSLGSIGNSGDNYTISKSISVPSTGSDVNISWLWNISMADDWYYTYAAANQSVLNFDIDNCSANNYTLYNFTMVDEETQVELNESAMYVNATINLQMYSYGTETAISTYSTSFNGINPYAICLSENLTGNYNVYLQTQYDAADYSPEFYHIQNATINYTDFNTSITLYDINESLDQEFKLIVKDSSFLPLNDALVYVDRKYIAENAFKTVELPMTDNNGETVAHLVPNTVIYNFRIVKYGVTIATFNNVIAVCQTPSIDTCTIDFNAFASGVTVPDFESDVDFNFTLGYNGTSRAISTIFNIPSGGVSTVLLNVTKTDALGTSVCTDTLTSASGTLSCTVPASIGNSTVIAKLYKDSNYIAQGTVKLDQKPSDIYGGIQIVLAFFLMITLIGAGMSDNPVFTIIFFMVGVICLTAMNLVANNGFIGATATILFLIAAIFIVVIKAARRN